MPLIYKRVNSLNLLLLALTWLQLILMTTADYPGVIELVGYSNRRARTHHMPADNKPHVATGAAASAKKMQADIETVKQNIEKYNKLLTLDTKNLPDSQKDMLERIVERVARLKESLDLEENYARAQTANAESVTTETAATQQAVETGTDAALLLDETTLLQLQTSMDELAAATIINSTELPVSATAAAEDLSDDDVMSSTVDTFTDATDADDQFVAARANNKIAAITAIDGTDTTPQISTQAGSQRTLTTSSKLKSRATKRPATTATKPVSASSSSSSSLSSSSSSSISTSNTNINNNNMATPNKRVQRPGSTLSGAHKQTTKQKLSTAAYTTTQPQQSKHKQQQLQQQYIKQQQQQQQQQQTKVTSQTVSDKMSSVTPLTVSDPLNQRISASTSSMNGVTSTLAQSTQPVGAYGNTLMLTNNYNTNPANNDLVYDEHVNTSAIIDSLNDNAREEYYQQKVGATNNKDKKPTATAKPTKYHYYPHNQHIYLLPECAIQQVCNAVYVRLNYTQPLCACPSRYRDPCSASLNEDDQHTTKLVGDHKKKAITLAKTCEATTEMRECRSPKDWSLLALQNTRTGKSHYLVICRCPEYFKMEGPMAHDQPTYASVPGIRVFGMMCVKPGYSVRRPSVQPPKRYQLQKPYYRPTTSESMQNSYVSGNVASSYSQEKDMYGRPSSSASNSNNGYHHSNQEQLYQQNQHQANYQYLNRPDSGSSSSSNNLYRPDGMSINQVPSGSIYGRTNEREEDTPIEATGGGDELKTPIPTSTQANEEARTTITQNNNLLSKTTDGVETDASAAVADADISVPISHEDPADIGERQKRDVNKYVSMEELADDTPEFPWDRLLEFQQSVIWN